MVRYIIVTLLLVFLFMQCSTPKNSNTNEVKNANANANTPTTPIKNATPITGVVWELFQIGNKDINIPSEKKIHFQLNEEDNTVTGYTGCNNFRGTYTLEDGNRLRFSPMASTKMACQPGMVDESEVLEVFSSTDNFILNNGRLMLQAENSTPLAVFKQAASVDVEAEKDFSESIVGKYWKLKTLEGKAVKMGANQEREIHFILRKEDTRLTGFSGCNALNGKYTLEEGGRIRFSEMISTLRACPDLPVNEAAVLKVFETTDNYTIHDDVLSLNVGRRAPLAVFEAVYFD